MTPTHMNGSVPRRRGRNRFALTLAATLAATTGAGMARADITIGFVTSLSGPSASIGVLYDKGMTAAYAYKDEIDGQKIKLIRLDDGSDPATASQEARKLIQQEHVDAIIGTSSATSTNAMFAVANELKVPFIAISPVNIKTPADGNLWGVAMPQLPSLMIKVIAEKMKKDGVKTAGFIGYSDAWGDLVYNGAMAAHKDGDGPEITTNERYSRTDTSVQAQALKVLSTKPDALLDGGSATQAALPLITLRQLGYKGQFYGTPALLNRDFIRVGGKAVNGVEVSAGPVIVTSQLPADHFSKKIGTEFHEIFKKVNGGEADDGFSGYTFDGWLVLLNAMHYALDKGVKPGTDAFHKAIMDGIYADKNLAGVHAIYNFKPGKAYNTDERGLVVVKLEDGKWIYQP
ncbi:ABC transporter substrate-binding protein [Acidimangrovimonas sediminis]|uniref:ABC transporter substrate-binding protein n=1 Tax=Acidimangrovimonas sediminis TaxID=2056283 RepID=UPI0018EC7340|nr:ABC transporter substrate-binding protein [Acidimangrovimonas sediminis]